MIYCETELKGAYIVELERLEDNRGFYARAFCQDDFEENGLNNIIAQTNAVFTEKKGTLRGMHYQVAPHQEVKFIRCFSGSFFDVIIDLRSESPTFQQWTAVKLTQNNFKALYVPEGFAHGFQTLENNTLAYYNVSKSYSPGSERGIRWNDPAFNIVWPIANPILSEKDKCHLDFNNNNNNVNQ